jgi:hypothetical protein
MNNSSYKELITKTVLEQTENSHWSYEDALKRWWINPRRDGGLRLTQMGDLEFRFAQIEYYTHDFKAKITKSYHSFMLELDRKIKCPYYIDVNKSDKSNVPYIRLYDSRISMMLNLYGDIDSYLNSIRKK